MDEISRRTIYRYQQNYGIKNAIDEMIVEIKVEILVNGSFYKTTFCSPSHLDDLAIGMLLNDGLLSASADIKSIVINKDQILVEAKTSSSHGNKKHQQEDVLSYKAEHILDLMSSHLKSSMVHQATGGVHVMSIADSSGIIISRQDIGRHNAVDKILGNFFKNNIRIDDKVFLSSGRITSEIIDKLIKNQVKIVVSRAAVSTYAQDLADDAGMTLIGFTRDSRFNIYSHDNRIII